MASECAGTRSMQYHIGPFFLATLVHFRRCSGRGATPQKHAKTRYWNYGLTRGLLYVLQYYYFM